MADAMTQEQAARRALLERQEYLENQKLQSALTDRKVILDNEAAEADTLTTPVGDPITFSTVFPGPNKGFAEAQTRAQFQGGEAVSNSPEILAEQARQDGFDLRSGAPTPSRFLKALSDVDSANQGLMYLALDKELRPQAGVAASVPVLTLDPNTGGLMYRRRVTKQDILDGQDDQNDLGKLRWTMVDEIGGSWGDLAEFGPEAVAEVGDVAISIGSSVATFAALKSPQATLAAGTITPALWQGMTRPLRVDLLQKITGMTDEEVKATGSDTDFDTARFLMTLAPDAALTYGLELRRFMKNRPGGKNFLTEQDYNEVIRNVNANRELFAEIEEITGIKLLDDRAPGGVLAENVALATERHSKMASRRQGVQRVNLIGLTQSEANVADATRSVINSNTGVGGAYSPARIQKTAGGIEKGPRSQSEIATDLKNVTNEPLVDANRAVETAQRRARGAEDALPVKSDRVAYTSLQEITDDDIVKLKGTATERWDAFDGLVEIASNGTAGIHLANPKGSPINVAGRRLEREAGRALSQGSATKKRAILADMDKMLSSETLDMKQLHVMHSELKQMERLMRRGEATDIGFNLRDVTNMRKAIEDSIDTGTMVRTRSGRMVPARADEVRSAWHSASEATLRYKVASQSKGLESLVAARPSFDDAGKLIGYSFEQMPQALRAAIFKPTDASVIADLVDSGLMTPGTRAALARELNVQYRQNVTPGGEFKQFNHEQFMREYGDHMDLLFNSRDVARITNVESMNAAVDVAARGAARAEAEVLEEFGDLAQVGVDRKSVVNHMMTSDNVTPDQIRKVLTRVGASDPKYAADIRGEMGDWIEGQLLGGKKLGKDSSAYSELVRTHGDKLTAAFGKQFVRDIDKIGRAMRVISGESLGRGPKDPIQSAWLQITRTVFGPLSNIQRRITAGNRLMNQVNAGRALQIINDPSLLHRFVQLQKLDPRARIVRTQLLDMLGTLAYEGIYGQGAAAAANQPSQYDVDQASSTGTGL